MTVNIPAFVKVIIDRIEGSGYEAFAVGGSLRDAMLGKTPHDWDVTTSARPETVIELFPDMRVIPTGLKHGTVTVLSEGEPIEITTYRVDGEYTDSRRPDSVSFTASVEDDLSRRDFTVNAMAYSEKRGLIDLFGGRDDLKKGIIRAVGDPEKRFTEDALRIMRAFRFSAQLGFDIEENTLEAAKKLGYRLKNIARERIGAEFMRLLASPYPEKALRMMGSVLKEILPCAPVPQDRFALAERLSPDSEARLALLLYGQTREDILNVAHALRLSNEQKRRVLLLSLPATEDFSDITPCVVRRLLRHYGEDFLSAARIGGLLGIAPVSLETILEAEAAKKPCLSVSALAISGSDLMAEGIAFGKDVGRILSALLEAVLDDPSLNEKEKLIDIAKKLVH